MERRPITVEISEYPEAFQALLSGARLYDSSCSEDARVIFIDRDEGFFLKSAAQGSMALEAELTRFFHSKKLAPELLSYISATQDWLLTARAPGEDCTASQYLEQPKRLVDTLAEQLHRLHHTDYTACPVQHHSAEFIAQVSKHGDTWRYVEKHAQLLQDDTLIHGDYCLPNIILDDWSFSSFIDVGSGGVGDKHVDLYWALWSLNYNLQTEQYHDRFLDAYGREAIDDERLRLVTAIETSE